MKRLRLRLRLGIWPQLLLTAAVGILIAVGATGYGIYRAYRASYIIQADRALGRLSQEVEQYLAQAYGLGGTAGLRPAAQAVATQYGGRIVLYRGGALLLDTGSGQAPGCHGISYRLQLTPPELPPSAAAPVQGTYCVPDPFGRQMRQAVAGIIDALILPGTLGLLGALAAVLLVSRRIAVPLGVLARAARRFGGGDLEVRVPEQGPGEIAELALEFNRMAQGLQDGQRQRQAMVADVAHELRTPLTVLRGYVEALRDGMAEPDHDTLSVVHEEAVHLQKLVDDLQDLAQADAAELGLDCGPLDVAEVLQTAATGFALQAAGQEVRLEVAAAPGLLVTADRRRVTQVIHNLVGNALRYTPAGGEIRLLAEGLADAIRVDVTDTGAGIPPEHLPHIFERFYRVDPSRARETGGSGLGLTIARRIVEAHGGTMGVESAVGRGTRFWFTLPRPLATQARQ